jgi:hypothetical protein
VDEGIKERETALKIFGHHVLEGFVLLSLSDNVKEG